MTIYEACTAALRTADQPKYLAIAGALEMQVREGGLAVGTRLPPQRSLAEELGVTLGTITRAYRELEQRGLIAGDVGRGTYVRGQLSAAAQTLFPAYDLPDLIHLDANHPARDAAIDMAALTLEAVQASGQAELWDYPPRGGSLAAREAGALWLGHEGYRVPVEEVVVTVGSQQGILLALAALAQPGQVVATEELVFPGVIAAARLLRVELVPVALDAQGLCVDALEEICSRRKPEALYVVPSLQNPTGTVMPAARRKAIAEALRRHDVRVIEDDVYRPLLVDAPLPLSSYCPERAFHLSSLSKSVAPGLRTGYLRVPGAYLNKVKNLIMALNIAPSSLSCVIASHAIARGWAARGIAQQRASIVERRALAQAILGDSVASELGHPYAPHLWLHLPAPWRAYEFEQVCQSQGVAILVAERFAVGRCRPPQAVRLSLTAAPLDALARGLRVVAHLLECGPDPAPIAV